MSSGLDRAASLRKNAQSLPPQRKQLLEQYPAYSPPRSLLVKHPFGRYLEKAIAKELKKLAIRVYNAHSDAINLGAIARANSICGFDRELVIGRLGFPSVEAYYQASSALHILLELKKPTPIFYAADDPLFDPTIVPDLQAAGSGNSHIDLVLTRYCGHVGYLSSIACQRLFRDPDPRWAWNRVLEWCGRLSG